MMDFIHNNETIPVSKWFELILPIMREGYALKVCPQGTSMIPFLVGGRDEAVLMIPEDDYQFQINDIVLYRIGNGIHVLHRICRIDQYGIYTIGDAQTRRYGPLQRKDILAVVDYIIRKGVKMERSNRVYIVLATLWRWLRPFRRFMMDTYVFCMRFLKMLGLYKQEDGNEKCNRDTD